MDQLMDKLKKLQLGKQSLEKDMKELGSLYESLQKELSSLQSEAHQVEQIHKEKGELCTMLQFQCEASEQDSVRQLNQNKKLQDQLKQQVCEIQEYKLKQRKQRMRFENQVQQLMKQHKNLHSVFAPERLPEGIASAENTNRQLLSAEQLKLAQLHKVSQDLDELKKQKASEARAEETEE
ncbi:unnamed protein product [Ophioblennius macclurei]